MAATDAVVCGGYCRSRTPVSGAGDSNSVFTCWPLDESRRVTTPSLVVKVIPLDNEHATAADAVLRDVSQLAVLNHPNVARVEACMLHRTGEAAELWVVQEGCAGGSLRNCDPTKLLQPHVFMEVLRQVLQGLAYLHERSPPVVHGSMKLSNICLLFPLSARRRDVVVKLGDYALADAWLGTARVRTFYSLQRAESGTTGPADDVWGAGLALLWASVGITTEDATTAESDIDTACSPGYASRIEALLKNCASIHGPSVSAVLQGMLKRDPAARLTADAALAKLDGDWSASADAAAGNSKTPEVTPAPVDRFKAEKPNTTDTVRLPAGCSEADVRLVAQQAGSSEADAVAALIRCGGDVVSAIMQLTM